ncbi:lactate utilization protein [Clostridium sp. BJN0001]|uniref:lactate utilization protein n=1 Tax=Clostridium sp. BJN0001 TaxID=2930219 RepID=UPI001FD4F8E6|nr:lactate utilization protein [Clostridium sp. BJN0001]
MDENVLLINKKRIERTIDSLKKNNINGYYISSKEELIKKIKEIVPEGKTVASGGSMTLFETGVIDHLRSGRYNYLDRDKEGLSREDIQKIYREAFSSYCYFGSTNAITEDGEIYNVDGNGNRVAAMLFGPQKVILVVGVNKIVCSIEDAVKRLKTIAAPANAVRLNKKTPCASVGHCMNCNSSERICNEYTVIKRQSDDSRMHVLFLNEDLGY